MNPADAHPELLGQVAERANRAAAERSPGARVTDVRPLTGGTSSLTFVAELVDTDTTRPIVLKVAPPGLAPVRNRDVLRQARLLRQIADRPGVRVPGILFDDAGTSLDAPPLFAMDMVAGECVEPIMPMGGRSPAPSTVVARWFDAVEALAALHAVDPATLDLGDEAVVTLGDEIDRWTRALGTVSTELSGPYLECAAALHATMPEALPPVINHGDFRLGNTLCEGDQVTAIIDWEIWTLGDPRVDLTWFALFTDEAQHPAVEPGHPVGTPTRAETLRAYETATGGAVADLEWFEALTNYKEASATALLVKRAQKAGPLDDMGLRMLHSIPRLLQATVDAFS
ncbi:MAG: hypothetical protein JWP31_564 [Aeromicrobium sp.]|nr:hypothetical protein [Aeromicrobium sp.]